MLIVPVTVPVKVDLVLNDERLLHIENLIDAKKQLLLDKQKKFKCISNQNHYLNDIKEDYSKYYNYIAQQKQEQITVLEMLNKYIHDLTVAEKLSKYNIEDAKMEQDKILREIKHIKKGLDGIVKNANFINS